MNQILTSRGMGKTTRLIWEAEKAIKNGYKAIFVVHNSYTMSQLSQQHPNIEFTLLRDLRSKISGRRNFKIFIDELDLCLIDLIGTGDFYYTLTIGDGRDNLYENN